jgi:drug/metabolite transporter (DMT)-like permease
VSTTAFAIVLLAAVLHAVWNGLVKASEDRAIVLALISLGHVVFGLVLVLLAPLPAVASWPFIAGSTLIHWAYYFLLYHSYRLGDLSQVYPIARGIAPVLVALGAQFAVGEVLPAGAWAGILMVSAGILLLSRRALMSAAATKATGAALATGTCIAAYSIADGMGVRVAEGAIGYIGWLFVSEIFVVGFIFWRRGREMLFVKRSVWATGMVGGLVSAVAYGLVIYAKSLTLLGLVSTLRETSVIFAALIGVLFLGERPWKPRILAAGIVLAGVILMATSI